MLITVFELFLDFTERSSFHGIYNAINASNKWLFRIIWLILVVLATFGCLYLTVLAYIECVVRQPTVTETKIKQNKQLQESHLSIIRFTEFWKNLIFETETSLNNKLI